MREAVDKLAQKLVALFEIVREMYSSILEKHSILKFTKLKTER